MYTLPNNQNEVNQMPANFVSQANLANFVRVLLQSFEIPCKREKTGSIQNGINPTLVQIRLVFTQDRSVPIRYIPASLRLIARAIQFGINPTRASCKRLDRPQTRTDAKRGKPKKAVEAF